MAEKNPLLDLRNEIDALDQQIMEKISARARCAQSVAEIKEKLGDTAYYRPEREAQVLRAVMERNTGPLDNEDMARLFRQIMSACLALEQQIKVAFLGPEGTFTQEAALKHFGDSAETVPKAAIDEVFSRCSRRFLQLRCRGPLKTQLKAWSVILWIALWIHRSRSVVKLNCVFISTL